MKNETKQFTMKMDEQTKHKLELLSNNMKFKFNLSAVVRELINQAHEEYAKK
jgi:predicted DNA-binding protein